MKLGPYEVLAPLGAGGMGEVYRARDTRLDRSVAIKILPAHLSSNPDLRVRFEREAKAVSSLNHPHICTLHDVGQQDGTDYLVMELVEGETQPRMDPVTPERLTAWAESCLRINHLNTLVQRELAGGAPQRAAELAERARVRAWKLSTTCWLRARISPLAMPSRRGVSRVCRAAQQRAPCLKCC